MKNVGVRYEIERFLEKFKNKKFDQHDVKGFFVNFRDYAPKSSFIREIGDFIAHPERKDRGTYFKSLKNIQNSIQVNHVKLIETGILPNLTPVYSEENIFHSIDKSLRDNGFNDNFCNSLDKKNRNDFMFCILGILSSATFVFKNQEVPILLGLTGKDNTLGLNVSIRTTDLIPEVVLSYPILYTSCKVHRDFIHQFFPWGNAKHFFAERLDSGELIAKKIA